MRVFDPKTGNFIDKSETVKHYEITKDGDLKFIIPKGEKGDVGPIGPIGISGKDGRDGIDGKDGKDGKSIVGPSGLPGKDGKDGRDGIDGKSIVGPSGPPGKDGKDGKANLIHYTSVKPPETLGEENDWAFTDLGEIFYKKNNKWEFYRQISGGGISRKTAVSLIEEYINNINYGITNEQSIVNAIIFG